MAGVPIIYIFIAIIAFIAHHCHQCLSLQINAEGRTMSFASLFVKDQSVLTYWSILTAYIQYISLGELLGEMNNFPN